MSRKRKVSQLESEAEIVTFNVRGQAKEDVRLRVFRTEYHVHSWILKMHSAFFFKFLDSPDKDHSRPTPAGGFKYEWITKVDDDGTWGLVAKDDRNVSYLNT
jgi:hypothetical protein